MTPAAIADILESAQVLAGCDFDTAFELRGLRGRRGGDLDRPWDPEDWETMRVIRHVAAGDRLLVEQTGYERRTEASTTPPAVNYRLRTTWIDGTLLTTWPDEPGSANVSGHVGPGDMFGHGFRFNLVEGRFGGAGALADRVRGSRSIECAIEQGVLTYRFEAPPAIPRYTIVVRLEPRVEIMAYGLDMDRPDGRGRLVHDFRAHAWETVDGLRIPRTASLTIGGGGARSRTEYTRRSFRRLSRDEAAAHVSRPPLAPGTGVYDARFDVSFEVGQRGLHFDGVAFELGAPMPGAPDEGFGPLVRGARQLARPPVPEAAASRPAGGWDGAVTHSFGVIDVPAPCRHLTHTFELTNRSDRAVAVHEVRRGCGVYRASADRDVVPPGATVRVTAEVSSPSTGRETQEVHLVTDHPDEPEVRLTMEASGRRDQSLRVIPSSLRLPPGADRDVVVIADVHDTDDAPPPPGLALAHDWLHAEFRAWQPLHPRDEAWAVPARWEGSIAVTAADDAPPGRRSHLAISATPDAAPLYVEVQATVS